MTDRPPVLFLRHRAAFLSLAFGAMDAATGLALLTVPAMVLQLLQLSPPPEGAMIFLRWIGAFVAGVGFSYFGCRGGGGRAAAVWAVTACIRCAVAVFLTTAILAKALPAGWALVAVSDALVAGVQIFGLRRNWWKEAS